MNKKLKPPFLSTGFNDSKKGIKERFSNIFIRSEKRNGLAVFMIIALLGIGASVLVSCRNISAPATEAEAEVQNGAKTLDNIISEILLSDSDGRFMSGECKSEGHRIFASEEKDGVSTVYAATMYGEYGFQNGNFVKVSGTGVIPAVITFKRTDAGYFDALVKYPSDGAGYEDSIREMFPKSCVNEALNADKYSDKLKKQEQAYAESYLKSINRTAQIGNYGDFEHILPNMNTDASNELLDKFYDYPYWIGDEEKIENGVRVVYSTEWTDEGNGDGIVTYTKKEYESGKILEKKVISVKDGKISEERTAPIKK